MATAVGIAPRGAGPRMALWVQVKVLELEKRLEGERVRLGELRKRHYALAGVCDAAEDGEAKPAPAPRRGILKKPPLAQKPGHGEVGSPSGRDTVGLPSQPQSLIFRFIPALVSARARRRPVPPSRGHLLAVFPAIALPSRWRAFVRGRLLTTWPGKLEFIIFFSVFIFYFSSLDCCP